MTITYRAMIPLDIPVVAAMEKEIEDHESRGRWHIVNRSTFPENAKQIKAIC